MPDPKNLALATITATDGIGSRSIGDRFGDMLTVSDFGAVATGGSAPLSTRFRSLGAAQAVYPHATSLTNEIDWAAAQAGVNHLTANGGGTLQLDGRYYCFNKPLVVLDSVRVLL